MNIDFDRLKYSLTGEYEEVMLEKQLEEKDKEIERLNNIINELENKIYYLYSYAGIDTKDLAKELSKLKEKE